MANRKYQYVKSFELHEKIVLPNIIVVRINARNFRRFSEVHKLLKPYDRKALHLMNECAKAVLLQFSFVKFSYGFSDEYSFVLRKDADFHQRRLRKILTVLTSFFSSTYVTKWKDFFPQTKFQFPLSFKSQVFGFPRIDALQEYLAWRQLECRSGCDYDTCLWELIGCGKTDKEAQEILEGTQRKDGYEFLYQKFNIDYKEQEAIFRQGTCIIRTQVEKTLKDRDGSLVQRLRTVYVNVHSEDIASPRFWNDYPCLCKDIGCFEEDAKNQINPDYVMSFECGNQSMTSGWVVLRIDGCHFSRFCKEYEFEKPVDARGVDLMNSCAVSVLEEFKDDIVFSYGFSDEQSFVLKKGSQLSQTCFSEIESSIVSLFSIAYAMKWKDFFTEKELKHEYLPYFDGRAICYPTNEILLDYLAWRQLDCDTNNHFNTCFWMLAKSCKSNFEAQEYIKGTNTKGKNELLAKLTGISDYYDTLPLMARRGSSIFWDKGSLRGDVAGECRKVIVEHADIRDKGFWQARPHILDL